MHAGGMCSQLILLLIGGATLSFGQYIPSAGSGSSALLLNYSATPLWIDYFQTSSLTFALTPPCSSDGLFIFKDATSQFCLSASCLSKLPTGVTLSYDSSHQKSVGWVRLNNVNASANGQYFALCTDLDPPSSSPKAKVVIGVRPRVLWLEFDPPNLPPVNISRGGDSFNHSTDLTSGESSLLFTVIKGVSDLSVGDFKFNVPELENLTFVAKDVLYEVFLFGLPTMRIRYRFDRMSLINAKLCDIGGRALAQLGSQRDEASVSINFRHDPVIAAVTVEMLPPAANSTYPFVHTEGDCLFHCDAHVCPLDTLSYQWQIYDVNARMPRAVPGNIATPGYESYFLLNASTCQQFYGLASRLRPSYMVVCQVSVKDTGATTTRQEPIFGMLDKYLSTTPAPVEMLPSGHGGAKSGYSGVRRTGDNSNANGELKVWQIAVIVAGCVATVIVIFSVICVMIRRKGASPPMKSALPSGNANNAPNSASNIHRGLTPRMMPLSANNSSNIQQSVGNNVHAVQQHQQQQQQTPQMTGMLHGGVVPAASAFGSYQPKVTPMTNGGGIFTNGGPPGMMQQHHSTASLTRPSQGGPVLPYGSTVDGASSGGGGEHKLLQKPTAIMSSATAPMPPTMAGGGAFNSYGTSTSSMLSASSTTALDFQRPNGYSGYGDFGGGQPTMTAAVVAQPQLPSMYSAEVAFNNTPRSRQPIQTTYQSSSATTTTTPMSTTPSAYGGTLQSQQQPHFGEYQQQQQQQQQQPSHYFYEQQQQQQRNNYLS